MATAKPPTYTSITTTTSVTEADLSWFMQLANERETRLHLPLTKGDVLECFYCGRQYPRHVYGLCDGCGAPLKIEGENKRGK